MHLQPHRQPTATVAIACWVTARRLTTLSLTALPSPLPLRPNQPTRYATPPTEGLGAALAAYEVTLEGPGRVAGVAPPVPAHAADPAAALPGGAPGSYVPAGGPSPVASDAQYELLLLAARGVNGGGPGFAARLLRAAGRGTNPLDAAPGWVLASTLGALGELPVTDMAGARASWGVSAAVAAGAEMHRSGRIGAGRLAIHIQ